MQMCSQLSGRSVHAVSIFFFKFHLAHVQDVLGLLAVEVGEPDVLGQALLHQLLHPGPSHGRTDGLVELSHS